MPSPPVTLQRKGGDEWTMVDEVSELMDIEGMSDISLPPLPPFDTGSQRDASEDEQGGHDPPGHQRHAATADDMAEFSGDGSDSSIAVGEGADYPVGGKKRSAPVRRRGSVRSRGRNTRAARAALATDATADDEMSSPSVSRPRPHRRAGRMERNGRRVDEGSPPLQSGTETSDEDSLSLSMDSSPFSRSPVLRDLGESGGKLAIARGVSPPGVRSNSSSCTGQGLEFEDNEVGGGEGGSTLVPFSLEEITCIASETVSATSSPFGTHQEMRMRTLSRASSQDVAAMPAASATATSGSGVCTHRGVPLAVGGGEEVTPSHHESYSTANQLSYATGFSTLGNSARVPGGDDSGVAGGVNAAELAVGGVDVGVGGIVRAARTDIAGGISAGNIRDRLGMDMVGSGAWSLSARGMTPLGRLFGGVGGVGAEWGVGSMGGSASVSASRGVNGSLVGLSTGYRTAVLEARAEAAEEQGDFWQRRAGVAEDANQKLRKLISAQALKIAELASGKQSGGVEEFKDSPPCDEGEKAKRFSDPAPTIEPRVNPGMSDVSFAEGDTVHGMDLKEQEERQELVESWRDARSSEDEEEAVRENDGAGVVDGASGAIGGIAFTSFSVGDVVMFFPTPEGNFLAFNVGCPGHLLSKECQELIGRDEHFRPYYVLGRIIEIQDVTCEEDNPYKLSVGQEIKAVSVETITPDLKAAGLQ